MSKDQAPEGIVTMETPHLAPFLQQLEQAKDIESKLNCALTFMENAISQEKTPDFKLFWEARSKCLDFFKEPMPPFNRSQFWNKFSNLSKEGRKLKDLLDEQSDFAAEQIDIAIQGLEQDLANIAEAVDREEPVAIPHEADALSNRLDFYQNVQKELKLLNLFASRVNSLRKELIPTEMRIRKKNQFFDRLSKTGDLVFPRRKTLIQEISLAFEEDIESFVKENFSDQQPRKSIFELREEVKALQSIAKLLTLNTHSFSSTRFKLSACWDQLKEKDKERKIEFDKKKEIFKQNFDNISEEILKTTQQFEAGELPLQEALPKIDFWISTMRSQELGRDDVQGLRNLIGEYRSKVEQKQNALEQERQQQEQIRQQQKREIMRSFRERLQAFVQSAQTLSEAEILSSQEALTHEIQSSLLNRSEKADLEKDLKPLKQIIQEKKEQALLNLPADAQQALQQLKTLLAQKIEQRKESKVRLEDYRKQAGLSGLDFQKAMDYNARLAEEKQNFEKLQLTIKEIEKKIADSSR